MNKSLRFLAIDIAEAIWQLGKDSEKATNQAVASKMNMHSSSLSPGKGRPHSALELLQKKHFIQRDVGLGWRLVQPIEDIENHLTKWVRKEKEPESTHVLMESQMRPKNGRVPIVYRDAKSIRLQVNDVTIIIDF